MASASHAMLSTNTYGFTSPRLFRKFTNRQNYRCFTVIRASSDDPDCNTEECAPDKEVGKVSMEWLAGEKTKVVGTFPPRTRGWTGYVEKDTAGQTNIYSVERCNAALPNLIRPFPMDRSYTVDVGKARHSLPAVYVAENAIASGTAGSSSSGAENTVAIASGLALVSIATASLILLQVGKNSPEIQTVEYNGPSLSYYISKFKPQGIVQVAVPSGTEPSASVQAEASPPEVTQI